MHKEQITKGIWKPIPGGTYYNIDTTGAVEEHCWIASDSNQNLNAEEDDMFEYSENMDDIRRWLMGNCFPTKNIASIISERMRLLADLQKFADRNNAFIDWSNHTQGKYYLIFDSDKDMVCVEAHYNKRFPTIYFSSYDIAKAAIDYIGKNRLKKYLFNTL